LKRLKRGDKRMKREEIEKFKELFNWDKKLFLELGLVLMKLMINI